MLFPAVAFSQEMFTTVDPELETRLVQLENVNKELLNRYNQIDKDYYNQERKKLNIAITLGSSLSSTWKNLESFGAISQGMAKITDINSIGHGNALGFDFENVIEELIINSLTSDIENLDIPEPRKNEIKIRWNDNIQKIIKNPIIQSLVQSNPLTSIASSLITTAINFTDNQIQSTEDMYLVSDELPRRYKDFALTWKDKIHIEAGSLKSSTQNVISNKAIENFSKSIIPYTTLFDQMANSTKKFQIKLGEIVIHNSSYSEIISTFDKQLMSHLNITKISDGPDRITQLLYVDETSLFPNYRNVIDRDELKDALKLANEYNTYKEKVNELSLTFYQTHIDYFEEYIDHLNTALVETQNGNTKFNQNKILESKDYITTQIENCKRARDIRVKDS